MTEDRYKFSLSSSMKILTKVLKEGSYSLTKLAWLMGVRSFSQLPTSRRWKGDFLKSVTLMSLFYLSYNCCQ